MGFLIDGDIRSFEARLNKIEKFEEIFSSFNWGVDSIIERLKQIIDILLEEIRAINVFENSLKVKYNILRLGDLGSKMKSYLFLLYNKFSDLMNAIKNKGNLSKEMFIEETKKYVFEISKIINNIKDLIVKLK